MPSNEHKDAADTATITQVRLAQAFLTPFGRSERIVTPPMVSILHSVSLACTPNGSPLLTMHPVAIYIHQLHLECPSIRFKVGSSLQVHGHREGGVVIGGAETSGERQPALLPLASSTAGWKQHTWRAGDLLQSQPELWMRSTKALARC